MSATRSSRAAALRLPLLRLLAALPDDTPWWVAREQLVRVLREFEAQNHENAAKPLRKNKAFMYAYWYGWAVYARNFGRALQAFVRRPPNT